jgi:hypothetical protein
MGLEIGIGVALRLARVVIVEDTVSDQVALAG